MSLRIEKLIIPTYFVIMDMEECAQIPILLGRPFLTTTRVVIDVKHGKLTFELRGENI